MNIGKLACGVCPADFTDRILSVPDPQELAQRLCMPCLGGSDTLGPDALLVMGSLFAKFKLGMLLHSLTQSEG